MTTPFKPPLAGPVLDRLVEVFDLRQWDRQGVLVQSTVRRFLRGERVTASGEQRAFRGIADALLASDLIPPDLRLPRWIAGNKKPRDVLADFLQVHARRWDELSGPIRGFAPPVADDQHIASAYLRLVVIDVAIRTGALLWLVGGPGASIPPPEWAEPKGPARYLRSLLDRCRPMRPTRERITAMVGVSDNTVDSWLDGGGRPDAGNITKLAEFLSSCGAGPAPSLAREIRLIFCLGELAGAIGEVVGQDAMMQMADRFVAYANFIPSFLPKSRLPRPLVDATMQAALVSGTFPKPTPQVPPILEQIARNEPDPVWRSDLQAATSSWFKRLQNVIARLVGLDDAPTVAPDAAAEPALEEFARRLAVMDARDLLVEPGVREALEEMHAGDPGAKAEWLGRLASDEIARGDFDEAIRLARAAVTANDLDPRMHYLLGMSLGYSGSVEEALLECGVAARLQPDWEPPRVRAGVILLDAERDAEALAQLETARRELPLVTPELNFFLAAAREFHGQTHEAIAAYEEVLAVVPDDAEALDRVAHLYFCAGDPKLALERCKRADHLGVSTVFHAWERGHYKGPGAYQRPTWARSVADERLRIAERPQARGAPNRAR